MLLRPSVSAGLDGVGVGGGGMSLVAGGRFADSKLERYLSYRQLASLRLSVTWNGAWAGISLLW